MKDLQPAPSRLAEAQTCSPVSNGYFRSFLNSVTYLSVYCLQVTMAILLPVLYFTLHINQPYSGIIRCYKTLQLIRRCKHPTSLFYHSNTTWRHNPGELDFNQWELYVCTYYFTRSICKFRTLLTLLVH
jgi:hypothetical protein